jgi:hypothetical protein
MLTIQTSPNFQPEKEYAFHVLLHEMLGIEYLVNYQDVKGYELRLPNGAALNIKDDFPLLQLPESLKLSGSWSSSPSSSFIVHHSSLDPFAATFFMLTRQEETNSTALDAHGRFPAEKSLAWQQGFLHRPVVNEWADELWEKLVQLGWKGARKHRKFQISLSCDVDHPRLWWSAADRVKTLAGSIFKRGDLGEAAYWLQNHIFSKKDPYDVFDSWLDLFEKNKLVAQFNFMGDRPPESDCWYPLQHPFVKNLMDKIAARGHSIGFHPSYEAFENQGVFNRELDSLRAISPLEISAGRQHYLRFDASKTWQMWEAAGLKEDSSLGYPEVEGFRCGICHDYPVFDTEQRTMLNLREKPLLAMDVTLAQYRRYTPEQASKHLAQLRKTVEKHGGDFTLLWHNSSWNTPLWEDWKTVLESFISG